MIPYGHQLIEEDDIEAVARVMRSSRLTQGPEVEAFEEELAKYCGYKYCVCVNSGTMALELACRAASVSPGRSGITSALTFKASASCLWRLGASVRFADIHPITWNMMGVGEGIDGREDIIGPGTKVIIPVDFAGLPADVEGYTRLARLMKMVCIRDACHSLGADIRGADMACLSFHPVKIITTGEGGAVLTNSNVLRTKLESLRHHALDSNYSEPGYNGRMSEMSAALGRSQLLKLDRFLARRRKIAAYYRRELEGMEGMCVQGGDLDAHVYHLFIIRLDSGMYNRDEVQRRLFVKGIETQVHYKPLAPLPNALHYYGEALTIPLFPAMSDVDVEYVMKQLKETLREKHSP